MGKNNPNSSSPRPLGLGSTVALVIASMVGAGVFVTSGFALAELGSAWWVMALWLVGGFVATCGAIGYGALTNEIAESGGEYVFLARRVHPLAGFLAGWVSLVAGFTVSMAIAATTLEAYLRAWLPEGVQPGVVATAVVLLCAAAHFFRVEHGAWLQNAIVVVKLCGLIALTAAAYWWLANAGEIPTSVAEEAPDLWTVCQQLMWISFSYLGFNAAVYVTEEVESAERNVPRAILLATLLVTVLYLAFNAVLVWAGPREMLAGQEDIAAVAMRLLGGPVAESACRLLVCIATLSSVSALTMAGPRVYAKMAADGLFPLPITQTGPPRGAIALQAALAVGVIFSATLREQLNFLGFLLSVSAATTVATLFLARRDVQKKGPTKLQLAAAAVFVVSTLTFACLAAMREPRSSAVAAGVTLAIGVTAYFAMRRWLAHSLS